MNKFLILTAVAGVFLSSSAAVRRLESLTVEEGSTASLRRLNASAVVADNPGVANAVLREQDVCVTGLSIGQTDVGLQDGRGTFASCRVMVVPNYWTVLEKMFRDNPEITAEIVGGKVLLVGSTASSETLKLVREAQALDPLRIVSQVSFSTEALQVVVADFLKRVDATNIAVNVVGREVVLSGKVYDPSETSNLLARVSRYIKDVPDIAVNVDGVRMLKQKIVLQVEFLEWNDTRARNLGINLQDSVKLSADGGFSYTWKRSEEGKMNEALESVANAGTKSSGGSAGGSISATINLAKENGVARKTYGTQLATQSGEPVEFKNGGTLYVQTSSGALGNGDLKTFDFGYHVIAKPVILDPSTMTLEFNMDYSALENKAQVMNGTVANYSLTRYTTKSKYIVRPGETIVMSGYKSTDESQTKTGWPFLSHIWGLDRLFGNTKTSKEDKEMLLVVTTDWLIEGSSESAKVQAKEIRERKFEVEMP